MIRHECDKCGARMGANDPGRFIVKMEIYAAAGPVDLADEALADSETQLADVLEALKTADPDEVEDQTYRSFLFDVCDACRRTLISHPLGPSR